MNLLRCATSVVADVEAATTRFEKWLNYSVAERGVITTEQADSWGAPGTAGQPFSVCRPASGDPVFLRFIQGPPMPDYKPIRSYGWAAIEICVQDVLAVNSQMCLPGSPYDIIGPPKRIDGLPTIYPMQVRGPDQETLYFTEILSKAADSGLPEANSLIDKLFILVLACKDMRKTADWFEKTLALDTSEEIAIPYSMINKAFNLPPETHHKIVTAKWQGDVFLEFDQYPENTDIRPQQEDCLPPGVAICSMVHPDFDRLDLPWVSKPKKRNGPIYDGRPVGVLRSPEGALIEVMPF